jgi:hypothetical protein
VLAEITLHLLAQLRLLVAAVVVIRGLVLLDLMAAQAAAVQIMAEA